MIPYVLDIHLAFHHAQTTAIAPFRIHFYTGQCEAVKETVDCAQRADEPAKSTVAEDAGQADDQHDHPFVGENRSQLIEGGGVNGILQKAYGAFKGAGRADVFAEARQDDAFAHAVDQRDGDHEYRQEDIFQIG